MEEFMAKNADEHLEKIRGDVEKVYEILEGIGDSFDIVYEEFSKEEAAKKMKKKEREAYLKKVAEERFPKLIKEIQGLNLAMEGVTLWVEEAKDELERQQDILNDIENLKDEIEDKKRELDV
jgi:hypothetical protein